MFKLVRFLKPYRKQVMLGPAFKLLEAILELLLPFLMAMLIDSGVKNNDSAYVLKIGVLMILTALTGAGAAYVCQYYASIASQGFGTKVRNALYEKIGELSFEDIDRFGTPSLVNRVANDVNQLQFAVAMLIRLVVRVPFLCIGGVVMAVLIDVRLSLVLLAAMPLFICTLYLIMSRSIPLYRSVQRSLDRLAAVVRENLSGVRVIRAFATAESERRRFGKTNETYADTAVRVGKVSALLNPVTSVIINLGIAAVLWFGGIRVNAGHMTQGQIIAFINYIGMILAALIVVANLVVTFTKAAASASRVNEIFNTSPSIRDAADAVSFPSGSECMEVPVLEFRNVSFAYTQAEYALKNISLKITKGQTIGIIGSTGAGKSTLVNLIARFYDVTEGEIWVNGVDIRKVRQEELRNKIGMVPQKAVLFTGTVEENIRWGMQDASVRQVEKAAEMAQADEFIRRMPQGYETVIARGGANLSGGQKQRLTIARALVRNPEILILDDSSSALDYATDAALRKALYAGTADMTVLTVTQRVSSIRNADLIVVLDDGQMAGMGTHESLLENCPVYQEIFNSQADSEVKPA